MSDTPLISLIESTGLDQIDLILANVVYQLKLKLLACLRSCYLVGSYAVGEAVATSDLDVLVVYKGILSDIEKQKISEIQAECQQLRSIDIELKLMSETHLFSTGSVRFHTDSLLLFGEDIRAAVPQKPVANHIRDSLYAQYNLFARVRPQLQTLTVPLAHPDPQGQFYGYDRRSLRTIDGVSHPGIKDLALIVFGAAFALTLRKAGRYVGTGRKSEIAFHYRKQIGDEWTSLVEAIDQQCRQHWNYLIPENLEQQQQLRQLCKQTLNFENYFLEEYKTYLLFHLPQANSFVKIRYLQQLGKLIYYDRAIINLLERLKQDPDFDVCQAAKTTLQRY